MHQTDVPFYFTEGNDASEESSECVQEYNDAGERQIHCTCTACRHKMLFIEVYSCGWYLYVAVIDIFMRLWLWLWLWLISLCGCGCG